MDAATVDRLNALNRRFYRRHAAAFDARRRAAWPGWERVAAVVAAARPAILDAGCGNARFGLYLARRLARPIEYLGVDASLALLGLASRRSPDGWRFVAAELVAEELPLPRRESFDLAVCFGVLHHIPGEANRRRLLAELAARVRAGGNLAVSFWRFGERPRFRRRALSPAEAGAGARTGGRREVESLDPAQLEPGDYLLPWGPAGDGPRPLRFCHFATDSEVERLVTGLGLARREEFSADGTEGDLNHYVILQRPYPVR